MEELSQYMLRIIAAAFILGIFSSFFDKNGSVGTLVRLMGGLFLTFTIISPVVRMDFSGITDFLEEYALEGERTAVWGESLAEGEYRTIIKSQVEAYILDKADALGVTLAVEVTLSNDETPVPEEAVLQGSVSPYAKGQLQQMMEEDLGISKENQLWIG